MKVAVTTSREDAILIAKAQDIAQSLAISYIPRKRKSIDKLREENDLNYLLIVEKQQVLLKGETVLFWHPNMAVPRLKALRQGKNDPMVEAMSLKPGYQVLDCTLGLASDALVSAYAVGPEGHVMGLESSRYLAFMTKWGLENYQGQNTHIVELLSRITVINEGYEDYLLKQDDNSFDVVYFDPMFGKPLTRSSSLNSLRPLANYKSLSPEFVARALHVARSRVVMKDNSNGAEFARLQPDIIVGGRYSSVAYGIWEKK